MLILNFTHPLTPGQRAQIEALAHTSIEEVRTIPVQIDQAEPLEGQITAIVDAVGLSSEEWQTRSLLINPPGYAPAAFVLLAELHGRIGHFAAGDSLDTQTLELLRAASQYFSERQRQAYLISLAC